MEIVSLLFGIVIVALAWAWSRIGSLGRHLDVLEESLRQVKVRLEKAESRRSEASLESPAEAGRRIPHFQPAASQVPAPPPPVAVRVEPSLPTPAPGPETQIPLPKPAAPLPVKPPVSPPPRAPVVPSFKMPGFDWEGLVGVRLFSWVAGVALLLAAVFFLRYSIDRGWLMPQVRMAIGVIHNGRDPIAVRKGVDHHRLGSRGRSAGVAVG